MATGWAKPDGPGRFMRMKDGPSVPVMGTVSWRPRVFPGTLWRGGVAHLSARRRLHPDKRAWEPEEFLAELGSVLRPADRQRVQAVRLYGESDHRTGERQHVAEIFTASDPMMRMRLYAAQEDLFERGDWFVVVRGEWLGSGLQADRARRLVPRRKTYDSMLRGEPVSIALSDVSTLETKRRG